MNDKGLHRDEKSLEKQECIEPCRELASNFYFLFLKSTEERTSERCVIIIHNLRQFSPMPVVCSPSSSSSKSKLMPIQRTNVLMGKVARVVIKIPTLVKLLLSDDCFIVQFNNLALSRNLKLETARQSGRDNFIRRLDIRRKLSLIK